MNDKLSFMIRLRQLTISIRYCAIPFFFGLIILLTACAKIPTIENLPQNASTPALVAASTPTPMSTSVSMERPTEKVGFYRLETAYGDENIYPNLWTNIDPNKIQNYTFSYPIESVTGKDGSNWYIGPFGIIRQKPDGSQVLFSNDAPNPDGFPDEGNFRWITVGPDGQVWTGGRNNILFRFDGKEWSNEGKNIPDAPEKSNSYCNFGIVSVDFDQDSTAWILTAELEIYHLVNSQWINFPNQIPDELIPVTGGCPLGMRVYSPDNITIEMSGCCESPDTGIHFDGKKWKGTDDPKDVKIMFQWSDYFIVDKRVDDRFYIFHAIYEEDKTIYVVPFFSWLAPPHGTYVVEMKDLIVYVTNQNVLENEVLIASFNKNTHTWRSFLLRNFYEDDLCSAHVDAEGYIWLQFNCFNRDSHGELLPLQDTLYRFSPDIFDDYQAPQYIP